MAVLAAKITGMASFRRFVYFSALLVAVAACEDTSLENRSLVNVLLVDAPGDFDQVWIEVLGVELLPAGVRGSAENANWINLPYQAPSNTVRISDLVDDQRLLIGRTEIQSGTISGIRLQLGQEMYLIQGENRTDLIADPDLDALLELDLDIHLEPGLSYDLYLDFDLAQSVRQGQGDTFHLVPKLRAFVTEQTAAIQGTVLPRGILPHIFVINSTDTLSTLTGSTGGFYFKGLPPTEYRLFVDAPTGYADTTLLVGTQPDTLVTLPTINLRIENP